MQLQLGLLKLAFGDWVHHALLDTSTQLQLGGQMGLLKLSFGDWVHALPDSLIQLVTPRRAMFMLTQNIVDLKSGTAQS